MLNIIKNIKVKNQVGFLSCKFITNTNCLKL